MKKILMILVCGILVLGVTGCGNKEKQENKITDDNQISEANKIITCVKEEKLPVSAMNEDGEQYTLTSTNKITYDKNMVVISASHEEIEKFDNSNSKDRILELKERYESASKRLEEQFNGNITSSVETNEVDTITNTMNIDYKNMSSEDINNTLFKDYIDSDFKFDVDKFKEDSISQNYECNVN